MCRTGSNSSSRRRPASIAPRRAGRDHGRRPLPLRRAGLRVSISKARSSIAPAKERPGFAGYQFGLADDEVDADAAAARRPAGDRRQRQGDASRSTLDKLPDHDAPARSADHRAHGRIRRPRGRAQAHAAGRARRRHDRRQAAVLRPLARRGRQRRLSTSSWSRPTARRSPRPACATSCCKIETPLSMVSAATATGITSRSSDAPHRRRHASTSTADKPGAHLAAGEWGRYRLEVSTGEPDGPVDLGRLRCRLLCRGQRRHAGHARNRARQAGIQAGDTMTVAVTARSAGRVTLNVIGDRLLATVTPDVKPALQRSRSCRSASDWGTGAYVVATLRRPLDAAAQRMPGRAIGVQWFSIDRKAAHARARHDAAAADRGRTRRLRVPVKIDGLAPARRRASSSPPSMSASSTSPTTSRRRRTTIISASAGSPPKSAISTAS